jgi:hypothetical protein
MEPTTPTEKIEAKAMEAAEGKKDKMAELIAKEREEKLEEVREILENIGEIVETRALLKDFLKVVKLIERELEFKIKAKTYDTEKIAKALARVKAIKHELMSEIQKLDNEIASLASKTSDSLLEVLSDDEIYQITKELSKAIRKALSEKVKYKPTQKEFKESLDNEDAYERFENYLEETYMEELYFKYF